MSPCFNKNRGRCNVTVPHNVIHNLDLENQGGTDDLEMTAGRGPLESGTSPQPPEDHFSVIHTAGNDPTRQSPDQIHVTANSPSPSPPLSVTDATAPQHPQRSQQQPDTTDHNTLATVPLLFTDDGAYTLTKPLQFQVQVQFQFNMAS